MKSKIMPTAVLGAICLVVALLLSVVNMFTAPVIADALAKKNEEALGQVFPTPEGLLATDKYKDIIDKSITKVYENAHGYVFQVETSGKSSGMVVMIGVDMTGKITGTKCTANEETKAYAAPVFAVTEDGYYVGMDAGSLKPFSVSGSTLTSKAYSGAVEAALGAYAAIKGGN